MGPVEFAADQEAADRNIVADLCAAKRAFEIEGGAQHAVVGVAGRADLAVVKDAGRTRAAGAGVATNVETLPLRTRCCAMRRRTR